MTDVRLTEQERDLLLNAICDCPVTGKRDCFVREDYDAPGLEAAVERILADRLAALRDMEIERNILRSTLRELLKHATLTPREFTAAEIAALDDGGEAREGYVAWTYWNVAPGMEWEFCPQHGTYCLGLDKGSAATCCCADVHVTSVATRGTFYLHEGASRGSADADSRVRDGGA